MKDGILENEVIETKVSIEEMLQQDIGDERGEVSETSSENKKTPNIYRGKALNDIELYQMTARQETQLILVAGLFHSGKTTMEMALYQMFLRGDNKRLHFAGSRTLIDVVERSKGLRVTSGNSTPMMARTSNAISDNFFHIAVVDEYQEKHNLVFTDFAGEVFEHSDSNDGYISLEKYKGIGNIIVLVDGEKLSGRGKDQALAECKNILLLLLQKKVINDKTNVHIVYSKNDMILESRNPNIEKIIENNNQKIEKMLGDRRGKIFIHRIAAISNKVEKVCNFEGLEELIESCLDNKETGQKRSPGGKTIYADRTLAQSSFDKYAWKG